MSFHKTIVITTLGKRSDLHLTNDSICGDGGGPRKRRRLTHLSADEKILRRKMKNRTAAQTARDRKKALMDQLEEQLAQLEKEKEQLLEDNAELRHSQATFEKENQFLKFLHSVTSTPSPNAAASATSPASLKQPEPIWLSGIKEEPDSAALPYKTEPEFPGSAEPTVSLPKEQIQGLSRMMMHIASCALTLSLILSFSFWKKSALNWETPAPKGKCSQVESAEGVVDRVELWVIVETRALKEPHWGLQQQMWTPSKK